MSCFTSAPKIPAGWPWGSLGFPGEALLGCLRPLAFPEGRVGADR